MTNYLDLLEFNYSQDCSDPSEAISRKTWILESLFDFFAYDSAMSDNLCDSLIKTIEPHTHDLLTSIKPGTYQEVKAAVIEAFKEIP